MARTDLARLQPPHVASKKRRSRGRKRNGGGPPARTDERAFSDLEQAFFAAAPPDDPGPAPEPERLDDAGAPPLGRAAWFEALRWAAATTRTALGRFLAGARGQRSACR
jgi:hypothetical protein